MPAEKPKNDRADRLDRTAGILDRALELGLNQRPEYVSQSCVDDGELIDADG